ncbi:MAG: hypothetical protein PHC70_03180 [Patescibacteria group bacterium]|nr:hypothetical protein [Patescibacteria group bacterium]
MTTRVVTDELLGIYTRREHELFTRLSKGILSIDRVLDGLQNLMEGNFDAIPACLHRLIDCDAGPYLPEGWQVKPEDQLPGAVSGQIEFDPAKITFHLDDQQKDGKTIVGNEFKEKLAGKLLAKANMLDHLLANTNLIPESWKKDEQGRIRYIYFWGTIYRDPDGNLYVRGLCWDAGRWDWLYDWLDKEFDGQSPAALLAS